MIKAYYIRGEGAHEVGEMDGILAAMCTSWLRDKFGCDGTITGVKVEAQEDIDKLLNLIASTKKVMMERGPLFSMPMP